MRADDGEGTVLRFSDIHLKGRHNISNVMASIAAAWACGVPREVIGEAVGRFHGVPHRLEMVTERRGVKYYNDTAATIPQAVLSALDSFTQPVILLAGGSDKGLEYGDFAKRVIDKAKDIILFEGKASDAMRIAITENLRERGIEREIPSASSMEEAVRFARQKASPGDIVLLSPGAASFGMFDNEFHRGEKFREAVNAPD
jgi:UDP-N-acetylmuramoylalanine--D-glutamate ligase